MGLLIVGRLHLLFKVSELMFDDLFNRRKILRSLNVKKHKEFVTFFDKLKIMVFLLVTICHCDCLKGQNYLEYQRIMNRVDEDLFTEDNSLALERLDSVFCQFDFIFAKHCLKALQISLVVNDSARANKWLAKSFEQGIPLTVIGLDSLACRSLQTSMTENTLALYDSLHRAYESRINPSLSRKIDSLLVIDQKYTRKVNDGLFLLRYTLYYKQWLRNNRRQFLIIREITKQYGFPGERLIGLGSQLEDSLSLRFFQRVGLDFLGDKRAYFMLLHYYSSPRRGLNNELMQSLINGYLPAYQYAAINDFMARWGRGIYGDYKYFNVWHIDPGKMALSDVNQRRHSIGLSDYDKQLRNEIIYNKRWNNRRALNGVILE